MVDRGDDVAGNEWIRCGEGTDLIAAAIDLSLRETATERATAFKAVATEKAHHLKESAACQWEDTRVKARELQVTAEDYIRQNPTKCVLSALGLGFLIGLIARR